MTIHQLRRLTPAEEAVIESAETGAGSQDEARSAAIAVLRREGLPHRRIEAWHYTDLRALVGQALAEESNVEQAEALLAPLLPGSLVVDLGADSALPAFVETGLTLSRGSAAPDWRQVVNHLDRDIDTVRLVNAAFGSGSTCIDVAAGAELAHAVELRAAPGSAGSRSLIECSVGAGAKATFVERLSAGGPRPLSTAVSHLAIGDGADVLWIIDQAKGDSEIHLGQLNVSVGARGVFRLFVLNAGGATVRLEVHAVTAGEGADIKMRGVNLISAGQHIDVTTTLNHTVAHTTSTEIFRNVVMGGHGVFQGMIKVSKGAQKTDARMACNSLLLSDDGEFSAKPELEIFADDVQCGHGATAGEIDANHLFYLMSRGIPENEARALLIKAFVAEVVEELENEAAVEALEARIDAWLATH